MDDADVVEAFTAMYRAYHARVFASAVSRVGRPTAERPGLTPGQIHSYRLVTDAGWTDRTPPKVRPVPG